MKTVLDIIGSGQGLLGLSYDPQDVFEDYLTTEHRAFLTMLSVIEEQLPSSSPLPCGRGRKPIHLISMIRAFLAKTFFRIPTTTDLIHRLKVDGPLRQICGFTTVPSPATFSRYQAHLASRHIMERVLYPMVRDYLDGRIVGHISRDSTAIEAREKPVNRKKDVKPPSPRKRGRPKKGEQRPPAPPRRLERQVSMTSGEALRELNGDCAWGCKRNSQGNISYWKGYKLHLDVTDIGLPVTAVVTGANVHDSQTAIPMEKLTQRNITHLYSLMDAAYDAHEISSYIQATGRLD